MGVVELQHVQAIPGRVTVGPYGELVPEPAGFIQPMPDGHVLTVTKRGHATVCDPAGQQVAEAQFGRGIAHVLTTPTGYIWVGYLDEGVFGNGGPGAHGLVRFAADLSVDWLCPEGLISDCYTLNVADETAWTCPYADFPVLRVKDGAVREWRNPLAGAHGLLVHGSRIALVSGYHLPHDRLTTAELRDEVHLTGEWTLTLPEGRPLPTDTYVICRGADLHAMAGGDWYHLDLSWVD